MPNSYFGNAVITAVPKYGNKAREMPPFISKTKHPQVHAHLRNASLIAAERLLLTSPGKAAATLA